MLKALNLNILMEHQHKSYELDAKIRFLECLKRLQGTIFDHTKTHILTSLLIELRELNYDHSQTLTQMQLHCEDNLKRHDDSVLTPRVMKEESTWAPTNSLDDELKLRDYYKPKMEPQQSSPQTNNFVPNASMGAFQAIRQQHIMQQRQQLNVSLLNLK